MAGAERRSTGVQWDIMKRLLMLTVIALMTMVGWVLLQHKNDVQKCLQLHSSEAQDLHKDLVNHLLSLSSQAREHQANLSTVMQQLQAPSGRDSNTKDIMDAITEVKASMLRGLDKLQLAGDSAGGETVKESVGQLQQKLEEVVKKLEGLEQGVQSAKTSVDEVKAGVTGMKTGVDAVKDAVEVVQDEIGSIKEVAEAAHEGLEPSSSLSSGTSKTSSSACPHVCVDVVFLYHPDDKTMFVDNGVLSAARHHLKGIRKFWIVSKSNDTFLSLMDNRTEWFPETNAPFKKSDWQDRKSGRPTGWLYQQTLKFWLVQFLPNSCNNLMFVDSDTLWLRDFNPIVQEQQADGTCKTKIKYNVATQKSGAWDGDIVNPEYHHFVKYMIGLPKALANTHTAINHWQLMQRDVMEALARSVKARYHGKTVAEIMVQYGLNYNGMSEYEAYFSFAWYFYQDRIQMAHIPFVMRSPDNCNYNDAETTLPFKKKTIIHYFTCHDNFSGDDYYTNCKGREKECDPALQE